MNVNIKSRPTNSKFKNDTGLDIEYLTGLTNDEVVTIYEFFTQTEAGKKFAENAVEKNHRLQNSNRRLGKERQDKLNEADRQITLIKNESDKKLINIMKVVTILLNKPITQIRRQDIKDILDLIKISLWS
jgi:hypothetical protein